MQTEKMMRVTSSPHIRANHTTQSIMLDVIIALIPTGAFGVYFFGIRALILILISVLSSVAFEFLYERLTHKRQTVSDLSAIVTGILIAYNIPASAPYWMPVVGALVAIVLVKMIFGGIGRNFVNPALVARAVLSMSWVSHMSGDAFAVSIHGMDTVTTATPLVEKYDLLNLLIGQAPGCIGEVSKIAILVGAVYLIIRGVISWRIPVMMTATVFVSSFIASGEIVGNIDSALYQVLSGGLLLGACFMATDYTTSPSTAIGEIVYAIGCGLVVFAIRELSPMAEGVSYAILFMNLTVPLIDRFIRPRVYGEAKKHA